MQHSLPTPTKSILTNNTQYNSYKLPNNTNNYQYIPPLPLKQPVSPKYVNKS
jgi:hypothetical protein